MGIEQSDNNTYYENKRKNREKKESKDFFESQKLKAETSNLLQSLAKEISLKFGIDIAQVKSLIENKTSSNLEDLQLSLGNDKINVNELLGDINSAKTKIEELSRKYREELKNSIIKNPLEIEKHAFFTSKKVFSDSFINQIQNPQNITDNILGAGVGIIDSTEAVIFFLYNLGKGILLTPFHIYLVIKGDAKIKL